MEDPEAQASLVLIESLRRRLAEDDIAIPPLPEVAQRVIALSGDDETSSEVLARFVHRDTGLATAVLRAANSAALGGSEKIVSLRQALARLGMQHVVEIALRTSLRVGPFAVKRYSRMGARIWRRSLATALFAKEVARELRTNVEVAFLCGLMWRVGQPLVLQALSQLDPAEAPEPLEAEAVVLDLDRDFTARAVETWELPPVVATAVTAARDAEPECDETAVVMVAERIADLVLSGVTESTSLVGDETVAFLSLYPERVAALCEQAEPILQEVDETP
jgi:HD-like signal output (HDOD) protein